MIREQKRTIKVNGHEVNVLIVITIHEDNIDCADLYFESEAQRTEYAAKFENGELFAGSIIVSAQALGLEGVDSLGACELVPNNLFDSKPFENSVNEYLKDYDLIDNAINRLEAQLEQRYSQLIEQAETFKRFSKAGAK